MTPSLKWWPAVDFTYKLERPFPFRYFTRSTIALLFVLSIIFTTFNVAANGYDMENIVTRDPNTTLLERHWYQKSIFTFGDNKLSPRCVSRDLVVGTSLVTTNGGFSYVLSNIHDANNRFTSIPYLNNTLKNCRIGNVQISLEKSDQLSDGGKKDRWWSYRYSRASLTSYCNVTTPAGEFELETTTAYAPNLAAAAKQEGFQYNTEVNATTHASAWWGMTMLRRYWMGTLMAMAQTSGQGKSRVSTGSFTYKFKDPVRTLEKIDDLDLDSEFSITATGGWMFYYPSKGNRGHLEQYFNTTKEQWSRAMIEGLSFAKTFYSLVLTDLGNREQPNFLTANDSLKAALQSPYNLVREPADQLCNGDLDDMKKQACVIVSPHGEELRMEDAYDKVRNQTGALGSHDATIYGQYTCSVPGRKSIVTIVWTTLLANFVLLQVAFSLTMFIATQVVCSRDPAAMYCAGCCPQTPVSTHTQMPIQPNDRGRHSMNNITNASGKTMAMSQSTLLEHLNSSEYTLLERRQSIDIPLRAPGC